MEWTNDDGDPINPRKAGGGRGGAGGYVPPGGTQGGPGGGFGGGFGGSPGGFYGGNVGGEAFGIPRRRIVMGPNGPISVAASPMSTDTVPAMLTPGEGVLNIGAMQQPGMEDFLNAANQQGVGQMAEGGVVPEPLDRAMLMKLLRLLLDDGGDEVQGLAFGGMVRPQSGGFQSFVPSGGWGAGSGTGAGGTQQFGQMSAMSGGGGGLSGRGFGGRRPKFFRQQFQQQQPVTPDNNPGPSTIGGPYDPWNNNPFNPSGGDPSGDFRGRMWEMLKQFGNFGSFSPEGSQGVMDAVGREARSNADALRQRSRLNADVSGLDAGQRGSYAMQSDLNTQGDVAKILSNAQLQQLLGQQQFGQNMLGKAMDANTQAWLARLASWMK